MARLVLAAWLAVFSVQATEVLTVIMPDDCATDVRGSATDPCPEGCPRCVCCARALPFVLTLAVMPSTPVFDVAGIAPAAPVGPPPPPHAIYHVPRASLI